MQGSSRGVISRCFGILSVLSFFVSFWGAEGLCLTALYRITGACPKYFLVLKVLTLAGFASYFSPFEGGLVVGVDFLLFFMLRYLGSIYALSLGGS
ncbi:uncharacterized protein FOBCDRAFT_7036 [Fusarium oxysporum Fo47]|jgi:hypothetical protein|uniref:uncharacterized protein n=1 Tax=Fusarium oxysporum Fo47 TaxID=660027 RepID=UPI002869D8DA|nr:uncharacterized protein FOBCDRAFT_7036 [Fusarium oxysporum Fo47]WJG34516.1 hypothetical protein FOBCDRAFT_7036 [Fusarium oxysporum Fo47]